MTAPQRHRGAAQDKYVPAKELVAGINFEGAISDAFPTPQPSLGGISVPYTGLGIDLTSGSNPIGGAALKAFQTAVEAHNGNDLNIAISMPDGSYDVELYFSEIDATGDRVFDVVVEDVTLLNNYQISEDRSRIEVVPGAQGRLDALPAGFNNGAVKTFRVEVSGGELNIDLEDAGGIQGPSLNALRVLDANPAAPRVTDVVLIGRQDGVINGRRMSNLIGGGQQLNDIELGSIEDVRIEFDRPVETQQTDLEIFMLIPTNAAMPVISGFSSAPTDVSATWGFSVPLPSNMFALRLESDTVVAEGLSLDGEWFNPGDFDQASGPTGAAAKLVSGNGTEGGDFIFAFTAFSADLNDDQVISAGDLNLVLNNWGSTNSDGDANGDGSVGAGDLDPVLSSWGVQLDALEDLILIADFNGDGVVDQFDRMGSTGFDTLFANQDVAADLNGDGN